MGSAEEPGSLPQLAQETVAEDACSPCRQQPSSCLAKPHCGAGALAMRNRCSMEPGGRGSAESGAEAPAVAQPAALEPGPGGRAEAEQAAGAGPVEKGEEPVPVSCSGQNGEQSPGPLVLPDGSIAPPGSPVGEGPAVASAGAPCPRLLPEPCLKGRSKDPGNAPAPLKHVVFLEPAHTGPEPDGAGAAVLSPEQGPVPPTCPQERSQEQPGATERDLSCGNRGAPGAAPLPPGGVGARPADAGGKAPALLAEPEAQLGSPAAPGAGVKGDPALPSPEGTKEPAGGAPGAGAAPGLGTRADAGQSPLGRAKETGPPAPGSSQPASAARRAGALPEAPAAAPSLKGQGKPGQSRAAPAEAGEGSGPPQSPAPEQQSAPEPGEEAAREGRTAELLSKTYSFELTPPPQDAGTQDAGTQDAGTQAGSRVSLVSVAVSPINPPDGAPAFTFHSRGPLKSPGPGLKPARKDAEMQVSIPVETRSVATGPMTPMAKSPQASYPEVRVKGAQEEPPEPIREVSWDEKGMTWEVYGATMEVEVLGMAIQKHLEKQIEEHGRQTVMTPQSTRASSVKGEAKRQPSMFRALLENLRRPRCCSRAGPAAE